jgi:hypothetical protein
MWMFKPEQPDSETAFGSGENGQVEQEKRGDDDPVDVAGVEDIMAVDRHDALPEGHRQIRGGSDERDEERDDHEVGLPALGTPARDQK